MPAPTREVAHHRATYAAYRRHGNSQAADQARRALELARTESTIAKAIATAPPLDEATLARIRSLIPPVPTGEAAQT